MAANSARRIPLDYRRGEVPPALRTREKKKAQRNVSGLWRHAWELHADRFLPSSLHVMKKSKCAGQNYGPISRRDLHRFARNSGPESGRDQIQPSGEQWTNCHCPDGNAA